MSDVSEFSCRTPHPDRAGITCVRKRWHGGDHRGSDETRLYSWPDGKPGGVLLAPDHAGPPPAPVLLGVPVIDVKEPEPVDWIRPTDLLRAATLALVLVVLLLLVASAPAYLRAIY